MAADFSPNRYRWLSHLLFRLFTVHNSTHMPDRPAGFAGTTAQLVISSRMIAKLLQQLVVMTRRPEDCRATYMPDQHQRQSPVCVCCCLLAAEPGCPVGTFKGPNSSEGCEPW